MKKITGHKNFIAGLLIICIMSFLILVLSLNSNAQHYLPQQRSFDISTGFVNQSGWSKKDNTGYYIEATRSVYNKKKGHWVIGMNMEKMNSNFDSTLRYLVPMQFYLIHGSYHGFLISDLNRMSYLTGVIGLNLGYETINKGQKIYGGLVKTDALVYGPEMGLESEIFLNDKLAIIINGREKLLLNVYGPVKLQQTFGIGLKFIINKGW